MIICASSRSVCHLPIYNIFFLQQQNILVFTFVSYSQKCLFFSSLQHSLSGQRLVEVNATYFVKLFVYFVGFILFHSFVLE